MMKKRMLIGGVVAAALLLTIGWGAGSSLAQDKEAVVKERQGVMKAQGAALGTIKKFTAGDADQAEAQKSADELVKLAQSLAQRFPSGTSSTDLPGKTNAKPVIWTEPDNFTAAYKQFVAEAEKLDAAVKSGDKAKVTEQFANVGKNGCGNCHGTFREKLS